VVPNIEGIQKEVDNPTNPEDSSCEKINNPPSRMPEIKTVNSQKADKEPKKISE
jgi:hypothetical protein